MNFGKLVSLLVTLCLWTAVSYSAEKVSTLSLDQVIRTALANNRNLKIAALEIERTKVRSQWAGRLSNPSLNLSGMDDFAGLNDEEANYGIAYTQKFPLTSRLRNERAVRKIQILLAETELAENRRLLAYETHQVAVEFLAAKTARAAQTRLIQLNGEIVDFLQKQVEAGMASKLDVTQMQLNGRALIRDAARIDVKMQKLKLALQSQLNFEPNHGISLKGNLAVPASEPSSRADHNSVLQRRPDYLAALVKADVASAELILQNSLRWDDIGVQLLAQRQHAVDDPTGLEKNTFLGLGVSIPLPFWNRNQEGIETANINKKASRRVIEAKEFDIRNGLVSALQARSLSWGIARDSTDRDLKLARDNFEGFRKAYGNAQVSIIQVQRAQEQLLNLAMTAVDLQREFHLADAQVRFVRGAYANLGIPSKGGKK